MADSQNAVEKSDEKIIQKCVLKSKVLFDKTLKKEAYVCSRFTQKDIMRTAKAYLEIIHCRQLNASMKRNVLQHTVENLYNYYNKGYLEYRKSVTEAGDFAAIEWEGRGSIIKDLFGRTYIDMLGGYGIYNAGIRHPEIVGAVRAQLERMPLNSQELLEPLRGGLAQILAELAPGDLQGAFFINNGTDAVEGALKLARLYTGKPGFISTLNGFHGKSMGSLSLMGKTVYRKPFEPLLDHVHFVPFGNARALEEEFEKLEDVGEEVGAFVVEPVQGEAGIIVPPDNYLPRVRRICSKHKALLILDEVQTGMGRTGKMFACEHYNVVPDILCLGKSLGGGVMPLSAFMASSRAWSKLEDNPFIHTSTFGGNALACAAGIAGIHVLLKERLPEAAEQKGSWLLERLRRIHARHKDLILDVRGKGLMIGVEFHTNETGYAVAAELFHRGILVAGTLISAKTIRLEPALNIPQELLSTFLNRFERALKAVKAQKTGPALKKQGHGKA